MILWFSSFFYMFTAENLIVHTRQDIFFSILFTIFFFGSEWKKTAAHHYDIICVMILLFMAPHFATLYLIHSSHFFCVFIHSPARPSARLFALLVKLFFRFYLSVFRIRPEIHTNMNVMNFLLLTIFFCCCCSLGPKWMLIRTDQFIGNVTLSQE